MFNGALQICELGNSVDVKYLTLDCASVADISASRADAVAAADDVADDAADAAAIPALTAAAAALTAAAVAAEVAAVESQFVPFAPVAPVAPAGIVKFKVAVGAVLVFVTDANVPAAPVIVVPTVMLLIKFSDFTKLVVANAVELSPVDGVVA